MKFDAVIGILSTKISILKSPFVVLQVAFGFRSNLPRAGTSKKSFFGTFLGCRSSACSKLRTGRRRLHSGSAVAPSQGFCRLRSRQICRGCSSCCLSSGFTGRTLNFLAPKPTSARSLVRCRRLTVEQTPAAEEAQAAKASKPAVLTADAGDAVGGSGRGDGEREAAEGVEGVAGMCLPTSDAACATAGRSAGAALVAVRQPDRPEAANVGASMAGCRHRPVWGSWGPGARRGPRGCTGT
mmetsp:Transcript_66760/g.175737  ORF Transcript_66760/g.175737 Transcript_66760/m.175737 type:complete len:240 (+) Transcript_66760:530-1249(+)